MFKKISATLRQFKTQAQEDWQVNDKSWLRPGCQAMLMYRFGAIVHGLGGKRIIRPPLYFLYYIMHIFIRNFYGIELYGSAKIGRRLRIAHQSAIVVHPNAVIGDDCLIRQGVSIGRASNHGGGVRAQPPIIGNRVEIGTGAVVVGGITIGDDVVIGPNAVVMTNIPSGSIVVSPPARTMTLPQRNKSSDTTSTLEPSSSGKQSE